jgi:MinD-like ATPase involved in chromosome partitioning or flagellar assembly
MTNIQYIYTWKDVDRIFKYFNRNSEYPYIKEVDVYHDGLVVTLNDLSMKTDAQKALAEFLTKNYDAEKDMVIFDIFDKKIPISWEEDRDEKVNKKITPLFKDVIYRETSYEQSIITDGKLKECPVIAFHSYKGGVGRTLSVLAFAKAWSTNKPNQKLLIVDSDIEAPGLTWLMEDEGERESQICYFDILEWIQSSEMDSHKSIDVIAERMQLQIMKIDNGKTYSEHYFLPTYRYQEQLLDIYANPESIVKGYKKKYILAEKLSMLGKTLGASAVLVDLRAGISEFSSPLLFDPRVQKYIVTSASFQSMKGTQLILKEICKGLPPITEDSNIPRILLTMTSSEVDVAKLAGELLQVYDEQGQGYTDTIVTELPFASELIHLESLEQIFRKLEERDMYKNIAGIVRDFYSDKEIEKPIEKEANDRSEIINKIHNLAENQINAEMNKECNVLMIKPISNLIKKFGNSVPRAVVIGAKGSGKTFLFRELLQGKTWENFCMKYSETKTNGNTLIIPLIAPQNFGEMNGLILRAVTSFEKRCDIASKDNGFWLENMKKLRDLLSQDKEESSWRTTWEECLCNAFDSSVNGTLVEIEQKLKTRDMNVLFVVDGLEEIFDNTLDSKNEKRAIKTLVQDIMNDIRVQCPHIGMIIFLRKDLSNNSIDTNREQFETQSKNYALNWSHDEALRLALWLIDQAVPNYFVEKDMDIENATSEPIKKCLIKFWGLKLGKTNSNEAYSYRWILAALSDFHSQLQARDIVRFLANATENVGIETYDDRIIMPKEVKNAVQACSAKKVEELEDEMKQLKPILEKLKAGSTDQKTLPFASGTFNLSTQEEKLMIQEGYLIVDDGKYYLPEIIRHALNFKYDRGARPKVLSLLQIK